MALNGGKYDNFLATKMKTQEWLSILGRFSGRTISNTCNALV